jgi:hypothetical protein
MTPQEKSEELYFKYSMKGLEEIKSILNRVVRKNIAKQCAIIAVDEIINAIEYLDDDSEYFWEEVKQELQKL